MRKKFVLKLASLIVILLIWQTPSVAQVGEPFQISAEMVAGGDVPPPGVDIPPYLISPDGRYVVYAADQDVFLEFELFAHRLTEESDEELCFPIKATNGNVAMICL